MSETVSSAETKKKTVRRGRPAKKAAESESSEVKDSQSPAQEPEVMSFDPNDDVSSPAESTEAHGAEDTSESEGGASAPKGDHKKQHRHKKDHNQAKRGGKFKNKNERSGNQQKKNPRNNPGNKRKQRDRGMWSRLGGSQSDRSALELGNVAEWEVIQSSESIAQALDNISTTGEVFDFNHYYNLSQVDLAQAAKDLGLETDHVPTRRQLLTSLLNQALELKKEIQVQGIVEIMNDDGAGLIVYEYDNYRPLALSTYIPAAFMKQYGIQRGQVIQVQAHPPQEGFGCLVALKVLAIMEEDPEKNGERTPFKELVPYYPTKRLLLETNNDVLWDNLSMRVIDLLTPIGLGQRGLIVAPPRTGKTVLLQSVANAVSANHPDAHLIVLLIDERPEEVTDFKRQIDGKGEVISSTFDEPAESHVHAAEMVCAKARCMVEAGKDVVVILDSITRLARAYNTVMPSSGKILSGGVEANALQGPKRIFGSARNIEDGGSLTILGSALIETGSRMDEVVFEEFKGTGNMEMHLDRALSDKRIFPALNFERSGTRKEELLYHPQEMAKVHSLRRAMKGVPSNEAMEMLIQRVSKTPTNAAFLMGLNR